MVQILQCVEQLEKFHHPGWPVGNIARQPFQHGGRALAAPVLECVGDVRPCGKGASADRLQTARPQQIADIRDYPFLACLDKPVLVKAGDIRVQGVKLVLNDSQQRPKRFALGAVPNPVYGGQQVVKPVGRGAHGCISNNVMPAGFTSRSSAGRITPLSNRAGEAQRIGNSPSNRRNPRGGVTGNKRVRSLAITPATD